MIQIFGNYIDELPNDEEYLILGFSPSSLPLKKRWKNNGLSADFIAEYFKTFFVTKREESGEEDDVFITENLKNTVKYIANELLENAMKFQDENVPFTARIRFALHADKLLFYVTNGISIEQQKTFQVFIEKLLHNDPEEMYFQAMKASAKEDTKRSGLGLLSMMCDYSAQLSWKFETRPSIVVVSTMVCLTVGSEVQ